MNKLQKSLLLNAVFSGLSGSTLILFQHSIAHLFGTKNTTVFWVVGALLVFFSCTIVLEMIKQRPVGVLWIIVQDMLWVVGSIILLLLNPFGITVAGNIIIAMIAVIVLFMAVNQANALAGVDDKEHTGIKLLRFERSVNASKSDVWQVVSDVANYHDFAPNIDKAEIISGQGEGMVRKCSHGNNSWTESCTDWVEEESYTFRVNTDAPDFPFPLDYMRGTWQVHKLEERKTNIVMTFELRYNRKLYNVILHPIMRSKFKKTVEELLDNWEKMLENRVEK